jgi:hypothetical protein
MRDARTSMLSGGVLYPRLERGGHPFKHVSVSQAAKSSSARLQDAEHQALMDEFTASGAHTMILSEESLWRADTSFRAFFARFRTDFRIEVVAGLRRQDYYMESLYNQALRTGVVDDCRSIAEFWRSDENRGRMAYHRVLSSWDDVADQVRAFDFARQVKQDGLVASFFRALDLVVDPLPEERLAKKSPDSQYILTLRAFREAGLACDDARLRQAGLALADSPVVLASKYLLGRRDRAVLLAECRDDRSALERDYGLAFAEDMPEEGEGTVTEPALSYLLALLAQLAPAATAEPEPVTDAAVEPEPVDKPAARLRLGAGRAARQARRKADREGLVASPEQKSSHEP